MDYTFQGINIGQNVQKEPWYTKINPNGKIPALVDHDKGGFALMEGAGKLYPEYFLLCQVKTRHSYTILPDSAL